MGIDERMLFLWNTSKPQKLIFKKYLDICINTDNILPIQTSTVSIYKYNR